MCLMCHVISAVGRIEAPCGCIRSAGWYGVDMCRTKQKIGLIPEMLCRSRAPTISVSREGVILEHVNHIHVRGKQRMCLGK